MTVAFLQRQTLLAFTCAWLVVLSVGQDCTGSDTSESCGETKCCKNPSHKCYEKDKHWASCKESCTAGINPHDPPQYQSEWSCKVLGGGQTGPSPRRRRSRRRFKRPTGRRRRSIKVKDPPSSSAVARHGRLETKGSQIVDQSGSPVRLRGMSLFWSQWSEGRKYYTEDVVAWLQKDWKATVIRAAMAVEEGGGYIEYQEREKKKVEVVVDAAIKVGIYVIIDWHSHAAEKYIPQAQEFFNEMAEKYGQYPNVLFEPYNEPKQQSWSSTIKPYHEKIVPIIRAHSQNLIICGTRSWSQEVNAARKDPVPGDNIAYTLHFYASSSSHQEPLRREAENAMDNGDGVPVFITEWGTCSYTGDGDPILAETKTWLDFLDKHSISDANWAIGDKDEGCAALKPGTDDDGKGGWKESDLTKSGKAVRDAIKKAHEGLPTTPEGRRRRRSDSSGRRRRRTESSRRRRRSSPSRRRSRRRKRRRRAQPRRRRSARRRRRSKTRRRRR